VDSWLTALLFIPIEDAGTVDPRSPGRVSSFRRLDLSGSSSNIHIPSGTSLEENRVGRVFKKQD